MVSHENTDTTVLFVLLLPKKNVTVKDYAIFSSWVGRAASAPGETKMTVVKKWLHSTAVKVCVSPSQHCYICVPEC